ncbi:hypothetical protein PanWU01x14_255970 [Parasponia andersonii]|uniref:DUF4283 domain-containing protein n=1 Tax=Parasponia andersonii TaxID=3476 RepID=A0A2P5BAL5_PARAD|nr:hypothetical protein PanWU01x14_255970 [Parasponia andersonii]
MEDEVESEAHVSFVDEVANQIDNFSIEDFSLDLEPDEKGASDLINSSIVGHFFTKKPVSNGLLRSVLGKVWKLDKGWRMREVAPNVYVFQFPYRSNVEFILENRPWSPCNGFLLLKEMPLDGLWKSANLSSTPVWLIAYGVPLRFMSDQNAGKLASLTFSKFSKRGSEE